MSEPVDKTMLVDDSEIDLFIHRRFLELCNFSKQLIVHRSAEAALQWLQNLHGESPPNIIFLDLNMPVMDGFTFLKHFNALPDEVRERPRIVVLTSSNSVADRQQVFSNRNVIRMITKPLRQTDIDALRTLPES